MRQIVAALVALIPLTLSASIHADVYRWSLSISSGGPNDLRAVGVNQNSGGSITLGGFVCEYDAPDTSRSDSGTVLETRALWCTHTVSGVQARTAVTCGQHAALRPLKMSAPGETSWTAVLGCR